MKNVYTLSLPLLSRIFTGILLILALSGRIQATHYETLLAGNYSSPMTWTTDGMTPCLCIPLPFPTGSGDTIDVNHAIALDADLILSTGQKMYINAPGSLVGAYNLIILGGEFRATGFVQVSNVDVTDNGYLSSSSVFDVTPNSLSIVVGTADFSGNVHVGGGLFVYMDGTCHLLPNTRVTVDFSVSNQGTFIIDENACMEVMADMFNGGSVLGDGYIHAHSDIVNVSVWSVDVEWCSNGFPYGLPTPPSCGTVCGPLPVSLTKFEGRYLSSESVVLLEWATTMELNNDAYILERSTDGNTFQALGEVGSTASAGEGDQYEWVDQHPVMGQAWYRISQRDNEGSIQALSTVRVTANVAQEFAVTAWPNPFQGTLSYEVTTPEETSPALTLSSIDGRVLFHHSSETAAFHHSGSFDLTELPAGMYLMHVKAGNHQKTVRLTCQ